MAAPQNKLDRARRLLLRAVDLVSDDDAGSNRELSTASLSSSRASSSATVPLGGQATARLRRESGQIPSRENRATQVKKEQQRLFGFNPRAGGKRKATTTKASTAVKKPAKKAVWSRDCLCMRLHDQDWIPSTEEKITLAAAGLGLKRLSFVQDGDERHIKDVVYDAFPQLIGRGGFDILRPGEQSKTLMVVSPPPDGLTVPYLKDVVNQSKIYVRPSADDIEVSLM